MAVVGPKFCLLRFQDMEGTEDQTVFRLGLRFRLRFVVGYNSEKMVFSATIYLLPVFATQNRLNTRVQDNQIRLNVG